jgi:hypothetical protein
MEDITQILVRDISKNFNKELEKNTKNALFNIGFEFTNDLEFYDFVSRNVTNFNHASKPYNFELRLNSGEHLLNYSYEPNFNLQNIEKGRLHYSCGYVQTVERVMK